MLTGLTRIRSAFPSKSREADHVLVVNGHPDPRPERFCAALCDSYAAGASIGGCKTRRFDLGRSLKDFGRREANPSAPTGTQFSEFLDRMAWADRLCIVFPMWLGKPPVALRLMFDAFAKRERENASPSRRKKARIVATASLPALLYRAKGGTGKPVGEWATSLSGIDADDTMLIGSIDSISHVDRLRWLVTLHQLELSGR